MYIYESTTLSKHLKKKRNTTSSPPKKNRKKPRNGRQTNMMIGRKRYKHCRLCLCCVVSYLALCDVVAQVVHEHGGYSDQRVPPLPHGEDDPPRLPLREERPSLRSPMKTIIAERRTRSFKTRRLNGMCVRASQVTNANREGPFR